MGIMDIGTMWMSRGRVTMPEIMRLMRDSQKNAANVGTIVIVLFSVWHFSSCGKSVGGAVLPWAEFCV